MPLAAVQQPYTLIVFHDDNPMDPREQNECLGKMVCWHSRYRLGDEHDYESPEEFLRELARQCVNTTEVLDYETTGDSAKVQLEYNGRKRSFEAYSYRDESNRWELQCTFPYKELDENARNNLLDILMPADLYALAGCAHIIKALYLYDHSGLRMSTKRFTGCAPHADWDSGQVGWIYASYQDLYKEFHCPRAGMLELGKKALEAEVNKYDAYISNECYRYQLFKSGEEIDSCRGLWGDDTDILNDLKARFDSDIPGLVDRLSLVDSCAEEIVMEESELDEEL